MSRDEILTNFQKEAIKEVGKSELFRFFIWSGGTALSFYYLQHRLSVDLDFLSQDLFRDEYLLIELRKIAKNLGVRSIEEQKKFGVKIDPVLFAGKALEGAEKLKEMRPLILKKKFFKPSSIKIYFQKEAETYLKKKITR